jgi:plasmid maintenance system antidote protein VapI
VSNSPIETVRDAVAKQGLSAVARLLGVPRTTVSSVLAGSAREGNVQLVTDRVDRLRPAAVAPHDAVALVVAAVTSDAACLDAAVSGIQAIRPGFGRQPNLLEAVRDARDRHGAEATAEALHCTADDVERIVAGEASVYVQQRAGGRLLALGALDAAADAAADAADGATP